MLRRRKIGYAQMLAFIMGYGVCAINMGLTPYWSDPLVGMTVTIGGVAIFGGAFAFDYLDRVRHR